MNTKRFQQILRNDILAKDKVNLNMIAVLEDVQEQYMHQIAWTDFRPHIQKAYKRCVEAQREFVKACDDEMKRGQDDFGFIADDIKSILDERFIT